MYDCRVLGIRRNELKVEEIPRDDIIREAAYFRDSPEKARKRFGEEGWYVSKVYDAPQAVMALLCHGKISAGTNRSGGSARILSFRFYCLACRDACLRHRHEIRAE